MLWFIAGFVFAGIVALVSFRRMHSSIWDQAYEVGKAHGQKRLYLDPKTAFDVSPFDEGWTCGYEEGYCRAAKRSARWKKIAKRYRQQYRSL